mmetsp:Transcript_135166/g.263241  ORF Transcript_135166/g.263241 Transcript_135166/m.263241 type:complete len:214 (-) Transcript_135166:365-1006(-)
MLRGITTTKTFQKTHCEYQVFSYRHDIISQKKSCDLSTEMTLQNLQLLTAHPLLFPLHELRKRTKFKWQLTSRIPVLVLIDLCLHLCPKRRFRPCTFCLTKDGVLISCALCFFLLDPCLYSCIEVQFLSTQWEPLTLQSIDAILFLILPGLRASVMQGVIGLNSNTNMAYRCVIIDLGKLRLHSCIDTAITNEKVGRLFGISRTVQLANIGAR